MTQGAEASPPSTGHGELRALTRKTLSGVATLVRIVTVVFAAILVIHIVLAVGAANPRNGITTFFASAANHLTLGLGNLFLPSSASLQAILNYGIAAVVWVIIGIILARLLTALSP